MSGPFEDLPDRALFERVREIVSGDATTEAELRSLHERADTWARLLDDRLAASESRLDELAGDPHVPLSEAVEELRQARGLRPRVAELVSLRLALDERARELRSAWVR